MPIKLPKGFARRKSAGTALDEVPNPPEPSFRVFERPRSGGKSFDGGHTFKRVSEGRPLSEGQFVKDQSFEDDRPNLVPILGNRGSGGTQHSASSGGPYDTSSSSARFSSFSTLPSTSSVENLTDDSSHAHPKISKPLPLLPAPVAQSGYTPSTAGSAISLTQNAPQAAIQKSTDTATKTQPSTMYADIPDIGRIVRPRAMTETSGSTATPPKLLDTDFGFGHSDEFDDFGNMFEGINSGSGQISGHSRNLNATELHRPEPSSSIVAAKPHLDTRAPYTPPPPLNIDRNRQLIASPYSNDSRTSLDGLMAPSPREEHGNYSYNEKHLPASQPGLSMMRITPSLGAANRTSPSQEQLLDSTIRRDSRYDLYRRSTPNKDADSILVMGSVPANHKSYIGLRARDNESPQESDRLFPIDRSPSPGKVSEVYRNHPQQMLCTPLSSEIPNGQIPNSKETNVGSRNQLDYNTPQLRAPDSLDNEDALLHDSSFREMAKSAERFQSGSSLPPKKSITSKVMTPAQFERYRKEHEVSRSKNKASESDESEDSDNYEDDEEERNKQLAKQRRKQEAHLSVYRQQMMRVTGEQPSKLAVPGYQRTGLDRFSMSSSSLAASKPPVSSTLDKSAISGRSSGDEDEEEDIPLGILAAHGFPSKDKPRNQFGRPVSTIRYTSETYPPPPQSIVSGSVAGGGPRGALPPFARNLPKDPYYGASIVNPSNRESLAFGNSRAGSFYGGSQAPSIHPGGLVGVIASEERSRAMRRGSPNTVGGYGLPGSGLPLPPSISPPSISVPPPGDQVQLQLSQQMTQMMQMQMQWMQQMMAMQSMPPGQQAPKMPLTPLMMQPGFPSAQSSQLEVPQITMQRPYSVGGPRTPVGTNTPPQQQRAMSMLDTEMAKQWTQRNGNGNRASLAPTPMMSGGLGPAPRYTPSITPSERSNVGMPLRYRPVSIAPIDEKSKTGSRASTMSSATVLKELEERPIQAPTIKGIKAPIDDDDDEEGWEEMRRQRERNRGLLRGKKDGLGGGLGDIFYPGT